MTDVIRYFQHDARRINHALKVYSFGSIISEETKVDKQVQFIIGVVSLLHDIGIKEAERKYQSSAGKFQEIEGPQIAAKILSCYNFEKETVERVSYIIGNHHTYSKIDGIDFQILVEADLLVNIFEDAIDKESVMKMRNSIFKTKSGIRLLDEMYLGSN
jgi:HD superfamily phosphodiesterase